MIGNDEAIDFCEDCGAGLREDGYCETCYIKSANVLEDLDER